MTASETKGPELSKNPRIENASIKPKKRGFFRFILLVFAVLGIIFTKWFFFSETLEVAGKVQPVKELEIKTRAEGILKEVKVENAQKVSKGDILFEFQNEALSAELLKAIQQKETTQEEIKRLEKLTKHTGKEVEAGKEFYKNEVIGKLKLEEIELAHSKSRGLLAEKRRKLEEISLRIKALQGEIDQLSVKAPFDGIFLGDLFSKQETYFQKGELLGNFFELKHFYLDAVGPEIKTMNVKVGDAARVTFKAFSGTFKGKVTQIDQITREEIEKVFKVKYVVKIRVLIENFPEGLRPGMRGAAKILPSLQSEGGR